MNNEEIEMPRWVRNLVVYGLLVAGAVIFSFPFLWMASTSIKVDREVQKPGINLMPITPNPRTVSPYVDETYYEVPEDERAAQIVNGLVAMLPELKFEAPPELKVGDATRMTARGLYGRLEGRIPPNVWEKAPVSEVLAKAREIAQRDPLMLRDVFENVYRRVYVGNLIVRSKELEEVILGEGQPMAERIANKTPHVATLENRDFRGTHYALLKFDFSKGDRVVLEQTYELPFHADRLDRIQLMFRPDDTWHDLWLTVEKNGRKLISERHTPLANFAQTQTATWQEPGPDDRSTKLRTWLRLNDAGPSNVTGANQLKLTFEFRKVSAWGAWGNKIRFNYDRVFDQMPFWRYVRVSVFLVIVNIVLAIFFSSLVAYAFSRLNWPGREFCFVLMLATMMIPPQVTMIPRFLIWKSLGCYDTLTPLWLGSAMGSAFFIFLMRQTMKGIPRDLEDAARIDGCGFFRIYWSVMLPLVKPSLAAIAIFTFMGTWNDFMGPLVYISDQRLYSLAFGLYAFSVQVGNNPVLTMAAALLMTVPVIVIFFFAQKYFIQGITMTGMKG
jgi:multiple sugar transport system permease protein